MSQIRTRLHKNSQKGKFQRRASFFHSTYNVKSFYRQKLFDMLKVDFKELSEGAYHYSTFKLMIEGCPYRMR